MTELKGKLINETTHSYLINYEGDERWVPRSLVSYIRKEPTNEEGTRNISFIVESWKAKQLGWH